MAYQVGQIRRSNLNIKKSAIPSTVIDSTLYTTVNPYATMSVSSTSDFSDAGIVLHTSDVEHPNNFDINEVYYFRFKVKQVPEGFYSEMIDQASNNEANDVLNVQISLVSGADQEDQQVLSSFSVPKCYIRKDENNIGTYNNLNCYKLPEQAYTTYTVVFSPVESHLNGIKFTLGRGGCDVLRSQHRNWLNGDDLGQAVGSSSIYAPSATKTVGENDIYNLYLRRRIIDENNYQNYYIAIKTNNAKPPIIYGDCSISGDSSKDVDFCTLRNLVSNPPWLKFGYQGRPSNILVVNRQPIRVGRSGIYELDNGTDITSLMIAAPRGELDTFILDYAYNG